MNTKMNSRVIKVIPLVAFCCILVLIVGCRSGAANAHERRSPVAVRCVVSGYTNTVEGAFSFDLTFHVFAQGYPVVIEQTVYHSIKIYDSNGTLVASASSSPRPHVRSYLLLSDRCRFSDNENDFEFVKLSRVPPPTVGQFVFREQINFDPLYGGQKFSEAFLEKARWVMSFGVTTYLMEPGMNPKPIYTSFDFDTKGEELNWVLNKMFTLPSNSSEN